MQAHLLWELQAAPQRRHSKLPGLDGLSTPLALVVNCQSGRKTNKAEDVIMLAIDPNPDQPIPSAFDVSPPGKRRRRSMAEPPPQGTPGCSTAWPPCAPAKRPADQCQKCCTRRTDQGGVPRCWPSWLLRTGAFRGSPPTADGPGALAGFIMTNHAYDLTEAGPDKLKETVLKAWADYMEASWSWHL